VYEWVTYDNASIAELRWDWLEKQLEDLSGEAAMICNPSGDFMHVNWNQWREDEFENVFDSDVWYRRLFYNTFVDVMPTTSVISTIPTRVDFDAELTLIALAKDGDQLGDGDEIVEYEWTVDGVVVSNQKAYNAPPRTLSRGWHGFSVRAKDNEGHWSNAVTFSIFVGDDYKIHIPVIFKP
jgi:hypothetical protein